MEIQEASENQVAKLNSYYLHSKKLIECMIKMDLPEVKAEAKIDFVSLVSDLMPAGNPTYLGVLRCTTIA